MKPCKHINKETDFCVITSRTCVVMRKFVTSDNQIKKSYPNITRCPSFEKYTGIEEIVEDELKD